MSGCLVTCATGPLDYTFRRYTIYPETSVQVDCSAVALPAPALEPGDDDVATASFNMERFFDDTNDPAVGEPVLTPLAYQTRLDKASMAIRDYLHAPNITAVTEMANPPVLHGLSARMGPHHVSHPPPQP